MDKATITKERIIKDYLNKQIELHKNDADFMPEKYNETWVEDTTKWALKDEFDTRDILEWVEDNKEWPSIRSLAGCILYMMLYNE